MKTFPLLNIVIDLVSLPIRFSKAMAMNTTRFRVLQVVIGIAVLLTTLLFGDMIANKLDLNSFLYSFLIGIYGIPAALTGILQVADFRKAIDDNLIFLPSLRRKKTKSSKELH